MRLREPVLFLALGLVVVGCGTQRSEPPQSDEVVLKVKDMV